MTHHYNKNAVCAQRAGHVRAYQPLLWTGIIHIALTLARLCKDIPEGEVTTFCPEQKRIRSKTENISPPFLYV
jgi:hypothetical protein